jgi:hypothetical protein
LTNLSGHDVSDETHAAVLGEFFEAGAACLTAAAGAINLWNRIVIALRFSPSALCHSKRIENNEEDQV